MTIKELADNLGTSSATLYRRVKAAGIDLGEYRNDGGELTSQGIQAVSALFDGVSSTKEKSTEQEQRNAPSEGEAAEMLEMRLRLESAQQRIADLENSLAAARADADAWRRRAETDAARLDRFLPSADDSGKVARHWWQFWKN